MNQFADTKPWWQSRGIWGSVITLVAALAGVFGYTFSETDQAQALELIIAIGGAIGGVLALVGRVFATKEVAGR